MGRFLRHVMILVAIFAAASAAHPHVFADVTVNAAFDHAGFVGVRNHWVFDEMYSAAMSGTTDSEEIKKAVLGPIASSNYYNYVLVETSFLQAKDIRNFKAEMKNGKLVLDFTVAFSVPAKSDYTMITIVVSDPTNYIQVTTDMDKADVEAPDEMDVDFFADEIKGLTLFRAFTSNTQGLYLRFKK